jgi:hypothetical protein
MELVKQNTNKRVQSIETQFQSNSVIYNSWQHIDSTLYYTLLISVKHA